MSAAAATTYCALTRLRINDSEDPFERMLAVLRFTFSKDLKHAVSATYLLAPASPHPRPVPS
jgi:hypothetical protein